MRGRYAEGRPMQRFGFAETTNGRDQGFSGPAVKAMSAAMQPTIGCMSEAVLYRYRTGDPLA